STGEDAYSVAMALLEHLGDASGSTPFQIFATDVSEASIDYARNGLYPQAITADVSGERLRRFFSKADGGYRITKMVRDLCVFARQDLTRDPPFSKLDLIVCRNVLIYLGAVLQTKLLNVFHYALRGAGFLVLGQAETTGSHSESFAFVNKKHRIYRKKPNGSSSTVAFPVDFAASRGVGNVRKIAEKHSGPSVQNEAQRVMLDR